MYAHANEMAEPLAQRCKGVDLPDGLAELIAACVMKSPAARPSATEIAGELDRMLVDMPTFDGSRRVQRLFTTTSASDFAQALQAQIRQVLLDLAATIEHPADNVERISPACLASSSGVPDEGHPGSHVISFDGGWE